MMFFLWPPQSKNCSMVPGKAGKVWYFSFKVLFHLCLPSFEFPWYQQRVIIRLNYHLLCAELFAAKRFENGHHLSRTSTSHLHITTERATCLKTTGNWSTCQVSGEVSAITEETWIFSASDFISSSTWSKRSSKNSFCDFQLRYVACCGRFSASSNHSFSVREYLVTTRTSRWKLPFVSLSVPWLRRDYPWWARKCTIPIRILQFFYDQAVPTRKRNTYLHNIL